LAEYSRLRHRGKQDATRRRNALSSGWPLTFRSSMSFNQAITAIAPSTGSQVRRLAGRAASFAAAFSRGSAAKLLPSGRRVGRIIGLASTVIVLFIAAFAWLVLREIDESFHARNRAHVEQL